MELTKSLPPLRDLAPMLAQAKYDTSTVSNAGWRAPLGKPAGKLWGHARIEDLRGRVRLGRVRLAGTGRLRVAGLGVGQSQIALRLASSALLLGRSRYAPGGGRRASAEPPRWTGPELRAAWPDPRWPPRPVASLLAGPARTPRPGRRHRAQSRSGMDDRRATVGAHADRRSAQPAPHPAPGDVAGRHQRRR